MPSNHVKRVHLVLHSVVQNYHPPGIFCPHIPSLYTQPIALALALAFGQKERQDLSCNPDECPESQSRRSCFFLTSTMSDEQLALDEPLLEFQVSHALLASCTCWDRIAIPLSNICSQPTPGQMYGRQDPFLREALIATACFFPTGIISLLCSAEVLMSYCIHDPVSCIHSSAQVHAPVIVVALVLGIAQY